MLGGGCEFLLLILNIHQYLRPEMLVVLFTETVGLFLFSKVFLPLSHRFSPPYPSSSFIFAQTSSFHFILFTDDQLMVLVLTLRKFKGEISGDFDFTGDNLDWSLTIARQHNVVIKQIESRNYPILKSSNAT